MQTDLNRGRQAVQNLLDEKRALEEEAGKTAKKLTGGEEISKIRIHQLKVTQQQLNAEKAALEACVNQLQATQKQLEEDNIALRNDNNIIIDHRGRLLETTEKQNTAVRKLEDEKATLEARVDQLEQGYRRQLGKTGKAAAKLVLANERHQTQLGIAERDVRTLRTELETNRQQLEETQKTEEALRTEKGALETRVGQLQADHERTAGTLRTEKGALEARIGRLNKAHGTLYAKNQRLFHDHVQLAEARAGLERELKASQETVEKQGTEIGNRRREIDQLTKRWEETKTATTSWYRQYRVASRRAKRIEAERQKEAENLLHQIRQLQEERASNVAARALSNP